nr:hypothetical protein [Saccharofermentans sp.]
YKNYKKMKDVEYEEVPLESQPDSLAKGVSPAKAAQTGATMSNASSSVRIAVGVIGLLILIPFLIVGFFLTIGAIVEVTQGDYAALPIAAVWDVIVIFAMIGTIKGLFSNNKKKKQAAPLTAEYPKPDKNFAKPVSAADKDKPEDRNIFGTNTSPELGDTGLFNRKHKTDYDDEDYQRMKRQGYE